MEQDGEEGREADRAQLAGVVIAGKYWLEQYIGSGSTGAVYRARHNVLEKPIALKILDPELARDADIVELFKREAKAASRIDHPNSVRILDFGADVSGLLYIAMEFVQGPDLLQVLDEQFPLSQERVVAIMSQLLGALAQAHEFGVVHRDIKPENVLVLSGTSDDGQTIDIVKVCDFGVAQLSPAAAPALPVPRVGPEHPTVIDANVLVGTPEYMSPEQARGEPLDPRSDVYAAGVVLFQLLTNRVPFTGDDVADVAMLQCYAPPPRPSSLFPVDQALEAICLKAMSKDPLQRYQNAREMRAALRLAAVASDRADTLVRAIVSIPPPAPDPFAALAPAGLATTGGGIAPALRGGAMAVPDPDTMNPPPAAAVRTGAPARYRRPVLALATAGLIAPAMAAAVYLWPAGNVPDVARALSQRDDAASSGEEAAPTHALAQPPMAAQPFEALALAVQSAAGQPALALQPTAEPAEREPEARDRSDRPRRAARSTRMNTATAMNTRSIARAPAAAGAAATATDAVTTELIASSASDAAADGALIETLAGQGGGAAGELEPASAVLQDPAPAPQQSVADVTIAPPQPQPKAPAAAESAGALQASARIKDVTVRGSLATSVVQRAIERIRPQLAACYLRSASSAGRNGYGAVNVEVELDERGRARRASAKGGALPGLDHCIGGVAGKMVARQAPDTGTVKATWQVAFER